MYKDEPLVITTDAGTNISMPLEIQGGKDRPATGSSAGSSEGGVLAAILGVLGALSLLIVLLAGPIDAILGPIAYQGQR